MENKENTTPPGQLPSSQTSPLSLLSGPDGKPLQTAPPKPNMPSRREKYNLVFMMFTLMNREERRGLRKALKTIQPRLDLMYPNGMSEGDIKNDLEKAANQVVPDGDGNTEPQNTEVPAESSVLAQPEGDKDSGAVTADGEEGGC